MDKLALYPRFFLDRTDENKIWVAVTPALSHDGLFKGLDIASARLWSYLGLGTVITPMDLSGKKPKPDRLFNYNGKVSMELCTKQNGIPYLPEVGVKAVKGRAGMISSRGRSLTSK
jgi:hypothetical protein